MTQKFKKYETLLHLLFFVVVVKINDNDIHFQIGKVDLYFYISLHIPYFQLL